jgi:LETM1 and EF-hand domain-containing protein 1
VIEFFEKAKFGEPLPNDTVIRMARLFKDELTLENVSRPQLVNMCQFMRLNPFGADSFLRFQVGNHSSYAFFALTYRCNVVAN